MGLKFKKYIFSYLGFSILFLSIVISCKEGKVEVLNKVEEKFETQDPDLIEIGEAIEKNPELSENYFLRASMLYEKSVYAPALTDINKALSIDSSKAEYFHLLSDIYLDYYKSGDALDVMEKTIDKFPKNIPSLLKLAELQLILKQFDGSFFTVQKILNIDKQNAEAFFMLGMIYRAQNEKEKAIASFQSAVEIDPEIIDAWIILGDLFSEKDYKIAERYYDNAIRIDAHNVQAIHAKAYYLQNSNRSMEAIELYKKINAKNPQYVDAYLNTGILYLEMDSLENAYEHFNILIKIEPQSHLGYYYRGITNMFRGDKEGAKNDLEQALVFNNSFEKAKIALTELSQQN